MKEELMHILLVNDDGIGAVGIMALLDAALEKGHQVTMCAPSGQQSAASHRITLSDPLYVKEYPLDRAHAKGYAITGTPADCVRLAFLGGLLDSPADMVISGINNGYNAGLATYYSGTVGAAREGAIHKVRSIAASIAYEADPENVRQMADYVIDVAQRYREVQVPPMVILNLNAPDLPLAQWRGAAYAPLSLSNFTDSYERRFAQRVGTYYWLNGGANVEPAEEGSDSWYVENGYAAFTLLGNPSCHPKELFQAMNLTK